MITQKQTDRQKKHMNKCSGPEFTLVAIYFVIVCSNALLSWVCQGLSIQR